MTDSRKARFASAQGITFIPSSHRPFAMTSGSASGRDTLDVSPLLLTLPQSMPSRSAKTNNKKMNLHFPPLRCPREARKQTAQLTTKYPDEKWPKFKYNGKFNAVPKLEAFTGVIQVFAGTNEFTNYEKQITKKVKNGTIDAIILAWKPITTDGKTILSPCYRYIASMTLEDNSIVPYSIDQPRLRKYYQ
jgi:hypothetical protein